MTITQQPSSLTLSGNMKTFKVANATADVDFTLAKGGITLLHQSYTPDSGGAVEIDVRRAVEDVLAFDFSNATQVQEQTAIYADFTATIDGTALSFRAVRCGVDRLADTAANFLTQNFLTWQPQLKQVTYYTPEFLTYYAVQAATLKLKAYYIADDGTETTETITVATMAAGHCYTAPMQYGVVAGLLEGDLPSYYDVWAEAADGSRLTYIQRYAADARRGIDEDWVLFENSLGGIDCFRAYGTLDLRAEHTHSTADMGDDTEEYYVDTQRLYGKNTGLLTQREAQWLLDFFPSRAKYIYTGSYVRRIVVTDSTAEGAIRQEPVSFSFTFRFTDIRPLLNIARAQQPAAMLDITVPTVGSFTLPPRLSEFSHLQLAEGALFPVQDPYTESWGVTTLGEIAARLPAFGLLTEPEMWRLLESGGASAAYAAAQIGLEHLRAALGEYMSTVDLSQYAKAADMTEQLAKKVDTAWFMSLFTAYDATGAAVAPNDYAHAVDNIRAMFGFWTDKYLSALGKTDAAAGGAGISEADMWAALGTDADTKVIPAEHLDLSGVDVSVDLSDYYTAAQTDALLAQTDAQLAKKVDTAWFMSLFTAYDATGAAVAPNDYAHAVDNIRAMFGFWTDKYLSALGKTDSVAYHEVYLTDEDGNYLLDSDGNYITTTRLLAALEGGVSEDTLWSLLAAGGAGEMYADAQIGLEHLRAALGEYMGTVDLTRYALATDVTLLQTYFSDGRAKKALRLSNTEAVGSTTQPVYFTADGIPAAAGAYSSLLTAFAYAAATRVLSLTVGGTQKEVTLPLATPSVAGVVDTAAQTFGGVKTFAAGSIVIGTGSNTVTLSVDTSGNLKVSGGVWTEKFVSALGQSSAAAGGAGISEADMWAALGTDADTKVIPAEHLDLSGVDVSVDLSKYYTAAQTDALLAKKSSTGHTHAKLSWSGYATGSYDGSAAQTISIPNNTNQLTNGAGFITSSGSCASAWSAAKLSSQGLWNAPTGRTAYGTCITEAYNNGYPSTYGTVLNVQGTFAGQLFLAWPNRIYYRSLRDIGDSWSDWSTVAFTSDNVATATALQTPRTLWGQTFDGTQNVSGDMTGVGAITASGVITAKNFIATSDVRMKDIVDAAVLDVAALAGAPLFRFRWRGGTDEVYMGTAAQYWQTACPAVVREDAGGTLGVDYGALGVAAGISLAREVVALRGRVQTLEARLARMEQMVAQLVEGGRR